MRKPRPDAFNTKVKQRTPDAVNLSGVVPLTPKTGIASPNVPTSLAASEEKNIGDESANPQDVVSRYHGVAVSPTQETTIFSSEITLIQRVRKAVKAFGKEAATHRFTLAEKKAIAEVVFAYRNRGIRTSENEVTRIAINYLFYEYQQNGENSILHQSLLSLNE